MVILSQIKQKVIYIYILRCFFLHPIIYQVLQSNTNYLHIVIWFQVFLLNDNLHTII